MLGSFISRQSFLRLVAGYGVIALAPRFALAEGAVAGEVARVRGTVSVKRAGGQVPLNEGDAVMVGDVVTTLADSRLRLALKDGSQINLGELTRLTIAEFAVTQETMSRQAVFDLQSGLLQAITAKAGAGSSFMIRTGNAVAATRGTDWIVEAKKAETVVMVREGKVEVQESALGFRSLPSADQDKALLLSAGETTIIGKLGAGLGPQRADGAKLEKYLAALAM